MCIVYCVLCILCVYFLCVYFVCIVCVYCVPVCVYCVFCVPVCMCIVCVYMCSVCVYVYCLSAWLAVLVKIHENILQRMCAAYMFHSFIVFNISGYFPYLYGLARLYIKYLSQQSYHYKLHFCEMFDIVRTLLENNENYIFEIFGHDLGVIQQWAFNSGHSTVGIQQWAFNSGHISSHISGRWFSIPIPLSKQMRCYFH